MIDAQMHDAIMMMVIFVPVAVLTPPLDGAFSETPCRVTDCATQTHLNDGCDGAARRLGRVVHEVVRAAGQLTALELHLDVAVGQERAAVAQRHPVVRHVGQRERGRAVEQLLATATAGL